MEDYLTVLVRDDASECESDESNVNTAFDTAVKNVADRMEAACAIASMIHAEMIPSSVEISDRLILGIYDRILAESDRLEIPQPAPLPSRDYLRVK